MYVWLSGDLAYAGWTQRLYIYREACRIPHVFIQKISTFSPFACLCTLLLRLIIAAVSYLVVGIIIQAGMRGARGVEVIPNLSFWKDFPFLLKVCIMHEFVEVHAMGS